MATGCTRQHAHPELQPPPGLLQAAPGFFKAKDSFVTKFNQPRMLPCVSMWSLKSCMPTAVGPTHYKCLFAPHLLKLLQKKNQPKPPKAIHPLPWSQVTLL